MQVTDENNKHNIFNDLNALKDLINSLSSNLRDQRNFISFLNDVINRVSSGSEAASLILEKLDFFLLSIIRELGLPFCDLIKNNNEILNYYINTFIKTKSEPIKKILITIINVFNYKSSSNISSYSFDKIISILTPYDNDIKQISYYKRDKKTEIEDIYDTINIIYTNIDNYQKASTGILGGIEQPEENLNSANLNVQQIKQCINDIKMKISNNKNVYNNSTIEFFNEKINDIEESFNVLNINMANPINKVDGDSTEINTDINTDINTEHTEINMEEHKKMKIIELKNRTFLYKDEELIEGEDQYIEFKNYNYPFNQDIKDEIKRQYCGFLNSHGGRIYIGINDLRIVKGIHLDYKKRDLVRNELINYTYDFYPKCRLNKINVYFIPIKSRQNNNNIKNLYVINIIILPGEPYNLYSMTNKSGYISAIRLPGQCVNLTAEEIHNEILKRGGLLKNCISSANNNNSKNKYYNNKEYNDKEYNDKDCDGNINNNISTYNNINNIEVIDINEDNTDIDSVGFAKENYTDLKKQKLRRYKAVFIVLIRNIDTSLRIKDINRFFNGCGCSYQKFPAKNGKSTGIGEIHFSRRRQAKALIQKYNQMNLCGTKQIHMVLKKRILFK